MNAARRKQPASATGTAAEQPASFTPQAPDATPQDNRPQRLN